MSLKQISMQALHNDLHFFGRQSKTQHELDLQRQQAKNDAALCENKAQLYQGANSGVTPHPLSRVDSRYGLGNENNGDAGHFDFNDAYSRLFDSSNLLASPGIATSFRDRLIRNYASSLTGASNESLDLRHNQVLPHSLLPADLQNGQNPTKNSHQLFGLPYSESDLLRDPLLTKSFSHADSLRPLDSNISLTPEFTRYSSSSVGIDKFTRKREQCKIPGIKSFELDLLRERQAQLRKLYHDLGASGKYQRLDSSGRHPRPTVTRGAKTSRKAGGISASASQPVRMPSLVPIANPTQKRRRKSFATNNKSMGLASTPAMSSASIRNFSDLAAFPLGSGLVPTPRSRRPGVAGGLSRMSLAGSLTHGSASVLSGAMAPFSPSRSGFPRFGSIAPPSAAVPLRSETPSRLVSRSIFSMPSSLRPMPPFGSATPRPGPIAPPAGSQTARTKSMTPKAWPAISVSTSATAPSPVLPSPTSVALTSSIPPPPPPLKSVPPVLPSPRPVFQSGTADSVPKFPPSASASAPKSKSVVPRSTASVSPSGGVTNPSKSAVSSSGPGAKYWKSDNFVLRWIRAMNTLPPKKRMVYLAKMFLDNLSRTNELLRIVAKLDVRPCVVTAQMVSEAQHLMLLHQINMASSVWNKRKLSESAESADLPIAKKSKISKPTIPTSTSATATLEAGKSSSVLSK